MPVPRLLVSVRSAAEAQVALAGGAELIDVKEPGRGSLGAAEPGTWRGVAEVVGQAVPLSTALGELADFRVTVRESDQADEVPRSLVGYRFAKLGLAGMAADVDWQGSWRRALAVLPPEIVRVAVVYADWQRAEAPGPEAVISVGAELGCGAVLFDTHDKRGGSLFDHLSEDALRGFMERARGLGWLTVLAGSLNEAQLARVVALAPDWVAVRGAVCGGDRRGALCGARVGAFGRRLRQLAGDRQPVQLAQCDRTG